MTRRQLEPWKEAYAVNHVDAHLAPLLTADCVEGAHEPIAPNCRRVLYIISCASSSALLTQGLVMQAQAAGWEVCVITTPHGTKFLDLAQLEQLTGHPVRSEYKRPEEPDVLPRADALVVFPATFNTIKENTIFKSPWKAG